MSVDHGNNLLKQCLSQVPVTALSFYASSSGDLLLLSGEDTELKVYSTSTGLLVRTLNVFSEQPIHGIHVQQDVSQGRIIVWGAGELALLVGDALESDTLPAISRLTAADWIYDAAISPYDGSTGAFITAHNELVRVAFQSESGKLEHGQVVSPSRPILFSGKLQWEKGDTVMVVGGTAFGEILVWRAALAAAGSQGSYEMLHILTGHEGSIFGVDLSSTLHLSNGSTTRLLVSCSDDRTVRVWDVSETNRYSVDQQSRQLAAARETGFGLGDELSSQVTKPIAVAMGHASRIWGVRFAQSSSKMTTKGVSIYSFGEDSTVHEWVTHFETNVETSSLPRKLQLAEVSSCHDGKHIWASALHVREDQELIATGGGDGGILIIHEPQPSRRESTSETERCTSIQPGKIMALDLRDASSDTQQSPTLGKTQDIVRRYDFIRDDQLLVTTSSGKLFLATFRDDLLLWKNIDFQSSYLLDMSTCYVLKAAGNGTAFFGTTSGGVYFYSAETGVILTCCLPGKVVEISCLSHTENLEEGLQKGREILVYLHGISDGYHLIIDVATGQVRNQSLVKGLDQRFRATSTAKISGLLIIGSRHGWLSILEREADTWTQRISIASPSRDAITFIVPLPSKIEENTASTHFLATSRDGKYRIYEISRKQGDITLMLQHEGSLPFGPMIEGAWFTDGPKCELVLYGFRSMDFVVWNETRRQELVKINCGGAHRTFALNKNSQHPDCLKFAFTRTSSLLLYSQPGTTHQVIRPGTHGREIRALSCSGRYIATGAEDTSIRIWEYQSDERGQGQYLRYETSVKAHVTGIQQLRWHGDKYLFSSAGNEEFFVWRIAKINSARYETLGVVCENVFNHKSTIGDLRIMDFDVSEDVATKGALLISMVFSNSSLETYQYSKDSGFTSLVRGSYTGACLTQLRHLSSNLASMSLLTASTDGHIAIWKSTVTGHKGEYVLQEAIALHQSAIKSLDMASTADGFRLLTGGDDNAIGVTRVEQQTRHDQGATYRVVDRRIIRKAHAAAVNGVVWVGNAGDDANYIGASVSNDQRLKLWSLPLRSGGDAELLEDVYSGVADVGDIGVSGNESENEVARLVVGGVGVEVWELGRHDVAKAI